MLNASIFLFCAVSNALKLKKMHAIGKVAWLWTTIIEKKKKRTTKNSSWTKNLSFTKELNIGKKKKA